MSIKLVFIEPSILRVDQSMTNSVRIIAMPKGEGIYFCTSFSMALEVLNVVMFYTILVIIEYMISKILHLQSDV